MLQITVKRMAFLGATLALVATTALHASEARFASSDNQTQSQQQSELREIRLVLQVDQQTITFTGVNNGSIFEMKSDAGHVGRGKLISEASAEFLLIEFSISERKTVLLIRPGGEGSVIPMSTLGVTSIEQAETYILKPETRRQRNSEASGEARIFLAGDANEIEEEEEEPRPRRRRRGAPSRCIECGGSVQQVGPNTQVQIIINGYPQFHQPAPVFIGPPVVGGWFPPPPILLPPHGHFPHHGIRPLPIHPGWGPGHPGVGRPGWGHPGMRPGFGRPGPY